jgi:hypothetical protein
MLDPLLQFDWSRLYKDYDALTVRFNPAVGFLSSISPAPKTDRALYYELRKRFRFELDSQSGITVTTYEAMLYWKLYSQPAAVANACKPLSDNSALREATSTRLKAFSDSGPEAKVHSILEQVKRIGNHQIWGMKSSTALPVRTTFLHFVSPSTNPIFDKQVLMAVGVTEKYANQKSELLQSYVDHAIVLAAKYSDQLKPFSDESPIRLIDMALWVTRGGRPQDRKDTD